MVSKSSLVQWMLMLIILAAVTVLTVFSWQRGAAESLSGEILINPLGNLETGENGAQVVFEVSLSEFPDSSVIVPFASSDDSEASVEPAMLTFSPMNWNVPQEVVVTGVDDDSVDGDQVYTLVVGEVFSIDPDFNDLDPADILMTNLDDDYVGVLIEPATSLILREGEEIAFTIRLSSRPEAGVSLFLTSGDPTLGVLSKETITIQPADWNVPVMVTITGVEDTSYNVTKIFPIVLSPLVSSDPLYHGFDPTDLVVKKLDNEYQTFSPSCFNNFAVTTQMIYEDYFEINQGWEIIAEGQYSSEYSDAKLVLRHETSNFNVRAIAPVSAADMPVGYSLSVDARIAPGAHPGTKLGVLFDWQSVSQFYRFYVEAGSNQYFIQKFDTTYQTIAFGDLPNGIDFFQFHTLAVERDGAAIRVYFDQSLLIELNDTTYNGGIGGLIVIAPLNLPIGSAAEGEFDKFTLQHTGYNFLNQYESDAALLGWELITTSDQLIDISGGVLTIKQLDQAESARAIAPVPEFLIPERYIIEARIRLVSGSDVETKTGILFDWIDPSSHYRYIILPGTMQYAIQKMEGSYQSLVIGALPPGFDPAVSHKLRLERDGLLIKAYLDGQLLVSYLEADNLHGRCGLTVIAPSSLEEGEFAAAEFDFFEVRALY